MMDLAPDDATASAPDDGETTGESLSPDGHGKHVFDT